MIMIKKRKESNQEALPIWILIFAVCYAFFHILPALINIEIKYKFWIGDLLDLFTPFVMIFLVYKLYDLIVTGNPAGNIIIPHKAARILILAGGAAFMEGHGIHLAANSIFRHLTELENTPLHSLTYFLDEILSHILWDSGIILVSLGLLMLSFQMKYKNNLKRYPLLICFAGIFFGFTFFVDAVEGQTVIFTFPFSILMMLVLVFLLKIRKIRVFNNAAAVFFFAGYFVALILFIVWLIWQNGFPEFSEIGWID
jgi:hypothetical protein